MQNVPSSSIMMHGGIPATCELVAAFNADGDVLLDERQQIWAGLDGGHRFCLLCSSLEPLCRSLVSLARPLPLQH
jgi:hypothetical protein